ncbi:MAG TPA: pilus assembly protein TadG-related protein [Candidatus Polarisedimenticolia bacterium]|nr:pilus assembly protein TadG-related protein [Candidatus Polarisedimenticolia bacterium]
MIRILRDQRGGSLMLTAVCGGVVLGMAALAIDVGMLYAAKAQAQNAADAGALAGAGSLLLAPDDDTVATVVAEEFAEKHEIMNQTTMIEPGADIQVDLGAMTVTVTARRTNERGNAVPTFFGKMLDYLPGGIDQSLVDVVATATAQVTPASAASCLKPWAIPDAYDDVNDNGVFDAGDYYEPGVTSWGTNYRNNNYDFGQQLTLKHGSPGDAISPGQFFPIDLPIPDGPDVGGDRYRENIAQCNGLIVEVGDLISTENGNMIGPTQQGVQDLIDLDPDAVWDPTLGIVNSDYPPGASPRIGRVPMFDPRFPPDSGKQSLEVTNIAGFFIEQVAGNGRVTGRLVPTTGTGEPAPGTMINTVRLVR